MRLHRGAPANVSSSDLAPRLDPSRMAAPQVGKLAAPFCSAPETLYIHAHCQQRFPCRTRAGFAVIFSLFLL